MIEKMSSLVTPKGYKTHYRLWVNGKVEVLFYQSNKFWIVTYASKPLAQRRFKLLDDLKAQFTALYVPLNSDSPQAETWDWEDGITDD